MNRYASLVLLAAMCVLMGIAADALGELITSGSYTYDFGPDGYVNQEVAGMGVGLGAGDPGAIGPPVVPLTGPVDFAAGALTDGVKTAPAVGEPNRNTFQVAWLTSNSSDSQYPARSVFPVTFDLGQDMSIEKVVLYSLPRSYWGVHNVEILYRADGEGAFTSLGQKAWYGLANPASGNANTLQVLTEQPGTPFTARYIQAQVKRSWTAVNVPLSEVEIYAVPEPATIGLLSLGGLLLAHRRR